MTDTDAPGLEWRARKNGRVPYWVAPAEARKQGYTPPTVRLSGQAFSADPTAEQMVSFAATCRRLQAEARAWMAGIRGGSNARYDGTLKSLLKIYETHEASPFHKISHETRRTYLHNLKVLTKRIGSRRLDAVTGEDILKWHANFKKPKLPGQPERIRTAHALMTMLRIVFGFGVILDNKDATRLAVVMSKMRFETTPPREAVATPEHVDAVRKKAREMGYPSIALATALMFECLLRQKDVIGEWVKDDTAAPAGALVDRGRVWRTGLVWGDHISRDLILEKPTSKSRGRKKAVHDLNLLPMVAEELRFVPAEKRIGPVIVCETTGVPWRVRHFRETWREIATAAGVPDSVWCMDARAGGITEGSDAGADIEHLRKVATHSNISTTGRYNRDALSKSRKVAELRVLRRTNGQ